MLMTPTSAPRSSVMKSFIKRNTPLRVDPKVREPVRLAELCWSRASAAAGSSLSPRLLGVAWIWAKAAVTWPWSRASCILYGHGLPQHRRTVLAPWALHCGLEAQRLRGFAAQRDAWASAAELGSGRNGIADRCHGHPSPCSPQPSGGWSS